MPRPRSPRPRANLIKEPIRIFVSSHQGEFAKTRKLIRARVEALEIIPLRKWIFVADLAEDYPGTSVREDIERLLRSSSLYILLIGRRSSKYVRYELDYALTNGIPILAYEHYWPIANPPPVKTAHLVKSLREAGVKIRGHKEKKFEDRNKLIDAILSDLAELIGKKFNHYTSIIRAVTKAE
jgi:hypothetical protein